ncbi:hypothetical protein AB6A40_011476 [Gnathostoma spinigerum]|uniref:GST N-terminal domain-containing protein n=1 Tax=Gnathostoma spinigerum TaxID=75299 RepID=A0ABD6F442_9BILA
MLEGQNEKVGRWGVPRVEIININLRDKPDWYLKKCPSGKVPALEHGSKIILDSRLIMEYTDEIFPTTRILPSDPYQKYEQRYLAEQLGGVS